MIDRARSLIILKARKNELFEKVLESECKESAQKAAELQALIYAIEGIESDSIIEHIAAKIGAEKDLRKNEHQN